MCVADLTASVRGGLTDAKMRPRLCYSPIMRDIRFGFLGLCNRQMKLAATTNTTGEDLVNRHRNANHRKIRNTHKGEERETEKDNEKGGKNDKHLIAKTRLRLISKGDGGRIRKKIETRAHANASCRVRHASYEIPHLHAKRKGGHTCCGGWFEFWRSSSGAR